MKSEVVVFLILLLLTAPAVLMAPPNRSNFSETAVKQLIKGVLQNATRNGKSWWSETVII